MKRFRLVIFMFVLPLFVSFLQGCGSAGDALGVGQLLPPVKGALPTSLTSGSAAARIKGVINDTRVTQVDTIKTRFFTSGPTDFMDRVKKVDERMTELDTRHQDSARKCVSETAQAWTLTGMPDSSNTMTGTVTMYFSCHEALSSSLNLYFGRKDGYTYMAELQVDDTGATPTMAVLGKVDDSSTTAEVWQIIISSANKHGGDNSKKRSAWLYIKGDKTNSTFQLASAATGSQLAGALAVEPFNGVGCGVRLNMNSSYLYGKGIFTDFNLSTSSNCSAVDDEVCVNRSDLSDTGATTACTSASLNTFGSSTPNMTWEVLSAATGGIEAGYTKALEVIQGTGIPTLTGFNTTGS